MINFNLRKLSCMAVCTTLLTGMLHIPLAQTVSAAATTDFFTSFETNDLPPMENTIELNSRSEKMSSGIDGNAPFTGIPGDITKNVEAITASGENSPNETKEKLIDGTESTKWLTKAKTGWVQLKLNKPEVITKYALTSANDSQGRDPKDWTFSGSNNGTDWKVLDERTDESFKERYQQKIYEIAAPSEAYQYYRINITKNSGEDYTQLAEIALSNGIGLPLPPPIDMIAAVSKGPSNMYTAKTNVGWSGLKAFTISGSHLEDGHVYSYNKIYDTDIFVTPNTELSYYIAPEFADKSQTDYSSTYAAVDLLFDDGTYLHELNAVDQHGFRVNPQDQGNSKTLYNNQWNFKRSHIGSVASGKTIKRILVAYDHPDAVKGMAFKATIDDIRIEGNPEDRTQSRLSDYVNTLRGTQANSRFSRGNNIPAVAVPYGFNFWIPKTDAASDWAYSYNERNNEDNLPTIEAFAMSHEPSPWMGDRQTFQIMPSDTEKTPTASRSGRKAPFQHSNEIAKPHYYSVTFENGIRTEFTPTDHAAVFRFTFTGSSSNLVFDNQSNNGGITVNADGSIQGYSDQKSGNSNGATRMFFYATFDKSPVASGKPEGTSGRDDVARYYKFDTSKDKVVEMRIASSLISVDQAKKNLELEIAPTDTFEIIKERAQTQWDQLLGKVEVEGATEDQLVTLYSNMYRLYLYPNSAYENVGTEKSPIYKHANQSSSSTCSGSTATQTCANVLDGKIYVNNGFWDTYRTTWPAYALFTPELAGEFIEGFVQQYRDGGWISRWSSPGYANIMVGTSANVSFADAYLKGVTDFDVQSFYQSAIKDATVKPSSDNVGRKGMAASVFNGYTSHNDVGQAMSWAVEGYINDFGIANLANALADKNDKTDPYNDYYADDYLYYINRAQNYVNMFNPELGFFNGRSGQGDFRNTPDNYSPQLWSDDYTESNAWNYAFHAPHDGQGLANLYGGKAGLAAKLDEFFSIPEMAAPRANGSIIHEMREARDVRMGQYGHSNQPSHHIIYMYNYAGQPWKAQEKVREVLDRLYVGSEIGQGYSGDEDNGEMSAWYIFSALGFYPMKMGSPEYAIGAPLFQKATIHLENGKDIVINAPENSRTNKYVQSLKVNGVDYNKSYLLHSDLANGATLDFKMGSEPSRWASDEDSVPKSITTGDEVPRPLRDRTDKLISQGLGKATISEGGGAAAPGALFDNNSNTEVSINSKASSIQYQFIAGTERVKMYTLTSGKGSAANDPRSWVLQGSNEGVTWTVLDSRADVTFQWRQQTRAFAIKDQAEYSYYRLDIEGNNGGESITLSEIELLGHDISDNDAVEEAVQALVLEEAAPDATSIKLPGFGIQGTKISWSSSDPSVISDTGKIVSRPGIGEPDQIITLTATVSKGEVSRTKSFDIVITAWSKENPQPQFLFSSGFESEDPQPDWKNSSIASKNVSEWCCGIGGMETKADSVDYDKSIGIDNNALLYSGNATNSEENYAYNQIFKADFEIKPTTVLTYRVYPEGAQAPKQPEHSRETSQYVSLDILFKDGTYLHELDAADQVGTKLNPLSQGDILKLDEWNTVISKVGAVAAGKVADQIILSFNATGHTGKFRGYVDDIQLYYFEEESLSSDATLSLIQLDGVDLPDFNSNTYEYHVVLPAGSTEAPTVVATTTDANASAVVSGAEVLPGAATIEVTAEDGKTQQVYTIYFTVEEDEENPKSNDATLSAIEINGAALADFYSDIRTYKVVLPAGTGAVPTVTAKPTNSKATVAITAADGLPGTTIIEVTAEDGTSKQTYEIYFTVQTYYPSTGPIVAPADKEPEDGVVTVNSKQIVHRNGKVTIEVSAGTHEVRLPYSIVELLGDSKLEVNAENIAVELPSELIKQLSEKLPLSERRDGSISLILSPLADATGKSLIGRAEDAMYADIRSAGQANDIRLIFTSKDGKSGTLESFDTPLAIRLNVDPSINKKLTGFYYMDDNGSLELIGGEIVNGVMIAEIVRPGQYAVLEMTKKFDDVASGHWAADIIKELAAKQIITGISATKFEPSRNVSRAEFVALLVRSLQLKQTGQSVFDDVSADAWYAEAVSIAVKAGIVQGKSAASFAPDAKITREEMVVMLMRAFEAVNGKSETATGNTFTDDSQIAAWAADSVNKAVSLQLIQGRPGGQFDPLGMATRAEAAQVIYNLLSK